MRIADTFKRPVRYVRRVYREISTGGHLEKWLENKKPVTIESFDFQRTKASVLQFLESLRIPGEDYKYRYSKSCNQTTLYASAYACMTRSLLGQLDELDASEKASWVTYFDSFQDSRDGLFYDPVLSSDRYADTDWWGARHLALHMILAYGDLGARPRYPFAFLKPYYDSSYLLSWLNQYDWKSPAIGDSDLDNKIMNIGCLLQFQRDAWDDEAAGSAVESLKVFIRGKINPATGLWGGFHISDKYQISRMVQFAYHIFPIFFYDRDFCFDVDRILPLVLKTQNRLGGFGVQLNSSACEDIDSIDLLLRLSEYAADEVKDRALQAVKLALGWVAANQVEDGGFVFRVNEPFTYGHLEMSASANQGALFPTWFRLLCLAMTINALSQQKFKLSRAPGYTAGLLC